MNRLFILVLVLILILIQSAIISAQGPAAAPLGAADADAPAPPGPANVIKILKKDGRFTLFIRLLQSTKVANSLNSQLSSDDSNSGLTVFAPTDGAFSSLKRGMLNSLNEEQKIELIQFHVLPYYLPPSQFQTISNPLSTQAGTSEQLFGMNVTVIGDQVNVTTGKTNAAIVHTIYTDKQLALYEVDKVLLPLRFYVPLPPPPPPQPQPKKLAPKAAPVLAAPLSSASPICLSKTVLVAMACVVFVVAA